MNKKIEKQAPCRRACPAGIDVPRYVRLIGDEKFDQALAVIREKIPFPGVCGYICFRPCESACRLNKLGGAIPIRDLKRFAAGHGKGLWRERSHKAPDTGKKVAIIGAGPAGLTAAYYLSKQGHSVIVFESSAELGGKMRRAVFEDGLPADLLDAEIEDIIKTGIEVKTNTEVISLNDELLMDKKFDAVFIAIGAFKSADSERHGVSQLQGISGWGLENFDRIKVNRKTLATSREGVFAGGDAVSGPSGPPHAIKSIASGRKAAVQIDLYLEGNGSIDEILAPPYEDTKADYPWISIGEREEIPFGVARNSDHVATRADTGSIEMTAVRQARRCLWCDLPIKVDATKCCGCFICEMRCSLIHKDAFIPAESYIRVRRVGTGETEYELSFTDQCDSCGVCARYCPYGALARG